MPTSILQEYPKFVSWKTDATTGLKVRNAGGTVTFSKTGTSTAKDAYSDQAKTTALANPATLDAEGELTIYLDTDELYRFVIKDSAGATIDTINGVGQVDASSVTSTLSGANLIPNGSFEDDTDGDGDPDEWTTTNIGTSAVDATDAVHGIQSMKFTSTGSGGGDVESPYIDIHTGKDLYLEFLTKSTVVDVKNIVTVEFFDQAQASLSTTTVWSEAAANPTSWTLKEFTVTTPASAVQCKVKLVGCDASDSTAGSTWYDGVVLSQKNFVVLDGSGEVPDNTTFAGTLTANGTSILATDVLTATASGGVQVGSPTGGDKGADTLNVAGHMYHNNTQMTATPVSGFDISYNTNIEDTVAGDATTFDVDAVIGAAWESVGPTGSSATNIWTAMDSLPSTAKYAIIKVYITLSAAGVGVQYSRILYSRATGDTTGVGVQTTIAANYFESAGAAEANITVTTAFVSLDSSQRFDLYTAGTGSTDVKITLVGWG